MAEGVGARLLYRAATGLEHAMADTDAERQIAIDAEAVKDVWNPFRISLTNLPYLAWGMGVNLWVDGWRETTKRNWVARQWEFKSLRGTLAGIRMAIDFAGRDVSPFGYRVISAITPPQKVFAGPSLTPAQRETWLSGLPQLRVWRVQETATAAWLKSFWGGSSSARQRDHRFCFGGGVSIPTTALSRLKRRARWIVGGVETDLPVASIGSYWQVHIPASAGVRTFLNRPIQPGRYLIPSTAAGRILTIAPKQSLPWRTSIGPSLQAVSSSPERITVTKVRGPGVVLNTPLRGFLVPSSAALRIFERYAVFDGSPIARTIKPAVQFIGVGRYGFAKYTAWIRVSIGKKQPRGAAYCGMILAPKSRFFIPHDGEPVRRVCEAVRAATRLSDRVLIEIGQKPRFIAGETALFAGIDELIIGRP